MSRSWGCRVGTRRTHAKRGAGSVCLTSAAAPGTARQLYTTGASSRERPPRTNPAPRIPRSHPAFCQLPDILLELTPYTAAPQPANCFSRMLAGRGRRRPRRGSPRTRRSGSWRATAPSCAPARCSRCALAPPPAPAPSRPPHFHTNSSRIRRVPLHQQECSHGVVCHGGRDEPGGAWGLCRASRWLFLDLWCAARRTWQRAPPRRPRCSQRQCKRQPELERGAGAARRWAR